MSSPEVYIIVPSLSPTGPIKGAIALCNGLAGSLPIHLVDLKPAGGCGIPVDGRILHLKLHRYGGWVAKFRHLRSTLSAAAVWCHWKCATGISAASST